MALLYISAKHCPPPPVVKNTLITPATGDIASYTCVHGHRFPDGTTAQQIHCKAGKIREPEVPPPCLGMLILVTSSGTLAFVVKIVTFHLLHKKSYSIFLHM